MLHYYCNNSFIVLILQYIAVCTNYTIMNKRKHFILMADVKDSRLKKGNKLMNDLKSVVSKTSAEYKSSFVSPITITLGDEFQSIVKSLSEGIDIVFNMEEYRIQNQIDFELRYVIYQGEIDTTLNTKIAHEMVGEGLTNARESLQELKKKNQNYYVYLDNQTKSKYLNQLFFLYHSEVKDWRKKDYEVISYFLAGKDYRQIAEIISRDASSVWRKERTLKMKEYFTLKELIKNLAYEL